MAATAHRCSCSASYNFAAILVVLYGPAETRVEIVSLYLQSYFNVQKLFFKPEKMLAKSITFVFLPDKTYLNFFSVILLD